MGDERQPRERRIKIMKIENEIYASYEDEKENEIGTLTLDYDSEDTVEGLYETALEDCEDKLKAEGKIIVNSWVDEDFPCDDNAAHCIYRDKDSDVDKEIVIGLFVHYTTHDEFIPNYQGDTIGETLMTYNGIY